MSDDHLTLHVGCVYSYFLITKHLSSNVITYSIVWHAETVIDIMTLSVE